MNIGLTEEQRTETSRQLNSLLAEEHVLYIKTRKYHWNLVGAEFLTLHEEFENQYEEVAGMIDELAERIRKLGGHANGSMRRFLEDATLEEDTTRRRRPHEMVTVLLHDHEQLVRSYRGAIKNGVDAGTEDLLVQLLRKHETMAWTFRSHQGK